MSNKKATKPAANNNSGNFTPTFRKYESMSEGEQQAFRQGAKTVENKVKGNLGFLKPKN